MANNGNDNAKRIMAEAVKAAEGKAVERGDHRVSDADTERLNWLADSLNLTADDHDYRKYSK